MADLKQKLFIGKIYKHEVLIKLPSDVDHIYRFKINEIQQAKHSFEDFRTIDFIFDGLPRIYCRYGLYYAYIMLHPRPDRDYNFEMIYV